MLLTIFRHVLPKIYILYELKWNRIRKYCSHSEDRRVDFQYSLGLPYSTPWRFTASFELQRDYQYSLGHTYNEPPRGTSSTTTHTLFSQLHNWDHRNHNAFQIYFTMNYLMYIHVAKGIYFALIWLIFIIASNDGNLIFYCLLLWSSWLLNRPRLLNNAYQHQHF